MATLRAKTSKAELTLRPYRIEEFGEPTWIHSQLEVRDGAAQLLSTTLSVTRDDLAELGERLMELSSCHTRQAYIKTTDDDLVLVVEPLESDGDVAVGFWTGEAYGIMAGYRFVAAATDLERFARDLRADELNAAPPANRLP